MVDKAQALLSHQQERGPLRATRSDVAARVVLAAGCLTGWLFREAILRALVARWEPPAGTIIERIPSRWEVLVRYLSISATVGTILALPLLVLAGLSVLAPRSAPPRTVSVPVFLCLSYATIAGGLSLAAFVAFPAFLAHFYTDAGLQWAYFEGELEGLVAFAIAFQICAVPLSLMGPARWRAALGQS